MGVVPRVQQLNVDVNSVAKSLDTPFEDGSHAQFFGNRPKVIGAGLIFGGWMFFPFLSSLGTRYLSLFYSSQSAIHPDESHVNNLAKNTHFCPRTYDDACHT